jgi:hypothetical protein
MAASADASLPAPAVEKPARKEMPSPASIATEIADRFFAPAAKKNELSAAASGATVAAESIRTSSNAGSATTASPVGGAKKAEPAAKVPIEIQVFVSENDVRRAMTRSEKIFIGRKTILTPSARDLGLEHEVFVETETGSIR